MTDAKADETVLVIGAAGHFAGLVVPELYRRGVRVRGFVRKPEEGDAVLRNGAAEIAIGDLADRTSVQKALQGIRTVFYIGPQFLKDEAELGTSFVKTCKDAGVRRFVFSSILHPVLTTLQVHAAKIPVEAAIVESGMEFAILQLAMFYQDITAAWPTIMEQGVFNEPLPNNVRLARVDFRDVAEAAAIALTENRLINGTFELCAEGSYSREEVASIMSDALGRPIKSQTVSFEQWATMTKTKPGDLMPEGAMYEYYGRYGSPGNSLALRAILGREPRTLRQFFDDLLAGVETVAT